MSIVIDHDPATSFYQSVPTILEFDYTNWREEKSRRRIVCYRMVWGQTQYHPTPQWLMIAYDVDKHEHRTFAVKDMENVTSSSQKPEKQP